MADHFQHHHQHHHRQPSPPRAIDELPKNFIPTASPPPSSNYGLPTDGQSCLKLPKQLPPIFGIPATPNAEAEMQLDPEADCEGGEDDKGEGTSTAVNYRPHHPQNHSAENGAKPSPFGFGVKGPPGGDCKRICLRHQRMVDGGARDDLQKRLDKLSQVEQQTANTVWSLFSSSSGAVRALTLRGLLTICCPSQLSFLSEQLKAECRLDPFAVLPRELSLKCMGYLDAISLGRAAQVSKSWKSLADDDWLWRTMCEQHIEKKCEKCGWGLPLLERRRKAKSPASAMIAQKYEQAQHNHAMPEALLKAALERPLSQNTSVVPAKRPRYEAGQATSAGSSSSMNFDNLNLLSNPPSPLTLQPQVAKRPWKSVYCERLVIARNWARGNCKFRVLAGHTDAITCLQIDETMSNPSYPVLMTGSWDRTVRVWNADTGECINVLRGHTRAVRAIQFDSVKLITASMDSTLKIWSWRTGQCIRTLEGHRDAVVALCFDKHVLASGSADSTIKVWNFDTAECFTLRGHREWVNQVKIWSPDSEASCSATPGGADPSSSLESSSSTMARRSASPSGAAQSNTSSTPSIKLLFSASDDGTVKVWDLLTRQCVRTLEGHVAQVQTLRVLTSDDHASAPFPLAPSSNTNTATITPSEARNARSQVTDGNGYDGFFHNQHGGAEASSSQQPAFVPASNLQQTAPAASAYLAAAARPPPDPSTLPFVDFGSGPAPMVISGSLDNTIKQWNVETGECKRTLFGHVEGVWAVDMDKLRIVSASHDRTIKVWDHTGQCKHTLVGHRGAVTSIALGDDKIISGSDDSTIRIWSFAAEKYAAAGPTVVAGKQQV